MRRRRRVGAVAYVQLSKQSRVLLRNMYTYIQLCTYIWRTYLVNKNVVVYNIDEYMMLNIAIELLF